MNHSNARRIARAAVITLSLFGLEASSAFADAQQDYYFQLAQQRYFHRPQLARSFGLEGSTIPTASDASSVMGNPAGIGFMKHGEVAGSYSFGEYAEGKDWPNYNEAGQDLKQGTILGTMPIMPKLDKYSHAGNIGMGWTGYDADTTDGNRTRTDGNQLYLAYGKYIPDADLSLGYGLTWVQDKMRTNATGYKMNDGFRNTFGFQQRPDDQVAVGGSFYFANGGPNINLTTGGETDLDTSAHGFDLGFGYREENMLFAMSGDYNWYHANGDVNRYFGLPDGHESGEDFSIRAGVETDINDDALFRVGYRYQANQHYKIDAVDELRGSAKYNAMSLGLGVRLDYVVLDYGVELRFLGHGAGEWQHVVTATVPFSLCEEDWT